MNPRDTILSRIRHALDRARTTGPRLHPPAARPEERPLLSVQEVLPAVGHTFEENVALFRTNADELRAAFVRCRSADELQGQIRHLAAREGWKRIGSHRGSLTDLAGQVLALPIVRTDAPYDVHELETCDAGITECDALVAQTGSVLLTSRSAGGRTLSVLPPHHVVLARRDQLVPGLPDAFALLRSKYGTDYPSMLSFVTGPSRTGDIERILVLGAHGPRQLTILLLSDSEPAEDARPASTAS